MFVDTQKILIAGKRPEISKLFELLMQQQQRQFISARRLEECFDLAIKTVPDLIIVDCTTTKFSRCYETVVALKNSSVTATIPILLIDDPIQRDEDIGKLVDIVAGVLSEPFNPSEIKKMAGQYL
ncbi:MAG: hypothetical protein U9Q61_06670 [Thermodesulfobacteriota bacterium]|nr:hypothetical protein [Thermodesulfobacteriota bacterium]